MCNVLDHNDRTPLMFAMHLNNEKVTELLLRNGADPHV